MNSLEPEKLAEVSELWDLVLEKRLAAETLIAAGLYNDSLSRSYYSAFNAVTLLFFLEGQSFGSHKQVLGSFNKVFVHGGLFPVQVARNLEFLFEARQTSDYDYHIHFDKDEASEGLEKLSLILESIRQFLLDRWKINLAE